MVRYIAKTISSETRSREAVSRLPGRLARLLPRLTWIQEEVVLWQGLCFGEGRKGVKIGRESVSMILGRLVAAILLSCFLTAFPWHW
jgi:hypothetical protein